MVLVLVLMFGLVMAYHDTEVFQDTMHRVFTPDPSMAAPLYWQKYRLLVLGGALLLLALFYKPVWSSARSLIGVYRTSPATPDRPELSALQAGFLYLRSQSGSMAVWLIDRCRERAIALRSKKGAYYPWSISRGASSQALDEADEELVTILFKNDETLFLRPILSDSNPPVRDASAKLYHRLKVENEDYCQPRKSSLLAWAFFAALLAEIPSYNALDQNQPAMILRALICAAAFAVPFYVFSRQLPALFSGSIGSWILIVASGAFALLVPLIVFSSQGHHYLSIAVLPSLAAAMAVAVYRLPFALKDESLLPRIIGYKKALIQKSSPFGEEEIAWNLALGIHTDIADGSFSYAEAESPAWLSSPEEDVQHVMKSLHQTFNRSVTRAIYGEQKSKTDRSGGGGGRHY